MSLRISGKHMNVGEALSQRINDRIEEAVRKYFEGGYEGQVTLEKSGGAYDCDCSVHLDTGVALQATARGHDATACFDDAAERIEKRLRRYKRRLKDHHGANAGRKMAEASYSVVAAPEEDEEIPEDFNPLIIAESFTRLDTQSVAQAVMQLDLTDSPVVVFSNAASGEINVVYRRSDGNIGWVDPSRSRPKA
ncbi:MAG: ribosome-associated translation inhibitor RaiA [Rhizobiaceae bacterium]